MGQYVPVSTGETSQNAVQRSTLWVWYPAAIALLYTVVMIPYSVSMYPHTAFLFPTLPFGVCVLLCIVHGHLLNVFLSIKQEVSPI
jgi:uncharacterized integral membrane protein